MTDADRLRAAADRLDNYANVPARLIDSPSLAAQDRATAALLRVVAAIEHDVDWPHTVVADDGHYDITYCEGCGEIWPCWPSTVHDAALALADVILGGDQ